MQFEIVWVFHVSAINSHNAVREKLWVSCQFTTVSCGHVLDSWRQTGFQSKHQAKKDKSP